MRKFIETIIDAEDVSAIRLIVVKKQLAQAALQRRDFDETDPKTGNTVSMKQDTMTAYYRAAIDMYATAQHEENMWWKLVNAKYKLPLNGISFDFDIERFYSTVDA